MGVARLSINIKRNSARSPLPLDDPSPTAKAQEENTWQL